MKNEEVEIEKEKNPVGRRTERREKEESKKKEKGKDVIDKILFSLMILVILEFCMIPCFVYAGMNQIFPIIMFLILPTSFAIIVLLLSKNTVKESKKKKRREELKGSE